MDPKTVGAETVEEKRLAEEAARVRNWKRWGPYLSERQWATVREDYSPYGNCWDYFPHDHARSRAYRWGEDGLLGIADRQCRLCFALALWNGKDPILKERLFGLTGSEGNHGEDVKELYYYLDSTPTHSYMKALYKYPQAEYPYGWLIEENRRRGLGAPELELIDTGVFNEDRYFDVFAEYSKASENDILIRLTIANRGPEKAALHLLPTLWFRNTWSWGPVPEESTNKPSIALERDGVVRARHDMLGEYQLAYEGKATALFSENETNSARIHNYPNGQSFVKDAFHEYVVHGRSDAVNPANTGTKFAPHYVLEIDSGKSHVVRLRLSAREEPSRDPFADFDQIFAQRVKDADQFYDSVIPLEMDQDAKKVARQGYAGLLWSKQFYNYAIREWLSGDPAQPPPPSERHFGRNREWTHLFNRDVISMPDKWEYPWFAAWDLAFHMIPFSKIDPHFAKKQLNLFLREWYMHPNGQIPAYEFAFGDVNPPVHAWACWRVYKLTGKRGERDRTFLARCFQKLLINFTWWVNRKDPEGNHLFSGGFLGLDNIGVFDRSRPLPGGGALEQSDGTSWMAMYTLNLLAIAMELAREDPAYEDVASKFWEHFIYIAHAMNHRGNDGVGLWDQMDGFFYDVLRFPDGRKHPMRIRSMVGLIPLFAVETLEPELLDRLPGFKRRLEWFIDNRPDLIGNVACMRAPGMADRRLLSIVDRDRLRRVLALMLDENEFLSPYGIRALSRYHKEHPYTLAVNGMEYRVNYEPAESSTGLFGGNSNWRGPIWFPMNYLLVESLQKFHHYLGDDFKVEFPSRSGNMVTLSEVAAELSRRLSKIFLRDDKGERPVYRDIPKFQTDPNWNDLILFHEYFHGDTGRGVGASHQTGWTGLVTKMLQQSGESSKRKKRERTAGITFAD